MGERFNPAFAPKKRPRCPALVTRVLAVIGAILLLERTLSYSVYRNYHGNFRASQEDTYAYDLAQQIGKLESLPSSDLAADASKDVSKDASTGSSPGPSKSLVVASTKGSNTSWVKENFPDWDLKIYVADDHAADLTVLKKEGREATVYLTYIINHYYDLPDYAVFIHAKRYQWHNDDPMYDGVPPVKALRLERVKEEGYVSLRCAWYPGCPVGAEPALKVEEDFFGTRKDFAHAYQIFFPNEKTIPEKVGAPCCSQFAVSREQIRKRPVRDYELFRHWIWTSGISGGKSGRVLEYMWHMIFGKPVVHCPNAAECYCKTYGLCHLKCPDQKKCRGRWLLPRWNAMMPENWPHEGLGQNGWPKERWWEEHYPPSQYNGFQPKDKDATPKSWDG